MVDKYITHLNVIINESHGVVLISFFVLMEFQNMIIFCSKKYYHIMSSIVESNRISNDVDVFVIIDHEQ